MSRLARLILLTLALALLLSASACSLFKPKAHSGNVGATTPDPDVVERDLSQPYERAQ